MGEFKVGRPSHRLCFANCSLAGGVDDEAWREWTGNHLMVGDKITRKEIR
jgi:hypothetical protein